ncbi:hypothetical protein [Nocardiopsis sp. CC223A]|uniref:hypothetical protein n=1 Tax=Nocardiopsis sp. CC223A TaxID=3044051 RepID=UPI00278BC207|nr:hypothetical protein [Nocardiopsis sp. CC223A]
MARYQSCSERAAAQWPAPENSLPRRRRARRCRRYAPVGRHRRTTPPRPAPGRALLFRVLVGLEGLGVGA